MAVRYNEALGILKQVAIETLEREDGGKVEEIALQDAGSRIAATSVLSPTATPIFDSATTDGYALSSAATANASRMRPVTFVVKGTIAAGDKPPEVSTAGSTGVPPCFEVSMGAQFPKPALEGQFDACVERMDVIPTVLGSEKMITITSPIQKNANRRIAGSDLQASEKILEKGKTIQPQHIMALASAGFATVAVRKKLRIAVWSTGNELVHRGSEKPPKVIDANGVFLSAALRELGVDVDFMGILEDNADAMSRALLDHARDYTYDVVLTTGAISRGKIDLIPSAFKALNTRFRFQEVATRPGNHALFATADFGHGDVPFLALPGSPVEAAACFTFLVTPFIKELTGMRQDVAKIVKIQSQSYQDLSMRCPPHFDCFMHGKFRGYDQGDVILSDNQDTEKISSFAASDCWVHIPRGHSGNYRDTLAYCYPHPSHGH